MAEVLEESLVFSAIEQCVPSAWHMVGSPNARKVIRKNLSDGAEKPVNFEGGKDQELPLLQLIEAAVAARIILTTWRELRRQGVILSLDEAQKEVKKLAKLPETKHFDTVKLIDALVTDLHKILKPEDWLKK